MPTRTSQNLLTGAALGLTAWLFVVFPAPLSAAVCDGISEAADTPLTTVRVLSGLLRPLLVTAPPGDVERLFIVEQDGFIRILKNGALLPDEFLDVSGLTRSPDDDPGGNEEGLLSLAFHPDYANNGFFFIFHTDTSGDNNLVARYTRSAGNPDLADTATRVVVLTIPHPIWTNHNGGMMAFAPDDGYLYIANGDAGISCDSEANAQDGASMSGKLLRIDVDTLPYSIPPDNPYGLNLSVNDEIWALGLRNPWRFSFDRLNSDLYLADVGQSQWEEVNYRPGTSTGEENYGWVFYEGLQCPNLSCGGSPGDCGVAGHVPPVLAYGHGGGACSVTGGYVYRGCRMPDLHGVYFYADYCAAFIRSFRMAGGVVTEELDRTAELAPGEGLSIGLITSFGEDAQGEIYIVDRGGEIFKILPILPNLQVSGEGADAFQLDPPDWNWEDLEASSSHPISEYRVYRNIGNGSGTFDCVFQGSSPFWAGGDPSTPNLDELFSYVVTAVNTAGEETDAGSGTGGGPRTLSCPP